MKKLSKLSCLFMTLVVMTISLTAFESKAQTSGNCIDKICKSYDATAAQLNAATSLEQLMDIDFVSQMVEATKGIDESCHSYELTQADKNKLIKSFDGVINTLVDKANEFSGGMAGAMIKPQIKPMMEDYHNGVNGVTTLGEYILYMSN